LIWINGGRWGRLWAQHAGVGLQRPIRLGSRAFAILGHVPINNQAGRRPPL